MTTIAEYVFEMRLDGLEIQAPKILSVPQQQLTGELEAGTPLKLTVRCVDVPEPRAERDANRVAKELYFALLLRFGENIEESEPPRLLSKSFSKDGSVDVMPTTASARLKVGRLTTVVGHLDIDQIVKDVELRVITAPVPTSAQLYAAKEMYATGLEAQNRVVRFLVFYSALILAALFKLHKGGQQGADEMILDKNPGVPQSISPRDKTKEETLYTKLRNDLIHAEERGWDPAVAIAEIEKHIAQFQKDVSRVFSHL